jgi:hypothetical protein
MCSSFLYTFSAHVFDRKYEDVKLYPFHIKGDSKLGPEYDMDEPSNKIKNAYLCTTYRLSLMSHINFHGYVNSMFWVTSRRIYIYTSHFLINRISHWSVYELISLMSMQ